MSVQFPALQDNVVVDYLVTGHARQPVLAPIEIHHLQRFHKDSKVRYDKLGSFSLNLDS